VVVVVGLAGVVVVMVAVVVVDSLPIPQ